MTYRIHFNPLPRKEGDARRVHYAKKAIAISIHSLVKRETILNDFLNILTEHFNPLPRKEGD